MRPVHSAIPITRLIFLALLLLPCNQVSSSQGWLKDEQIIMGTLVRVELAHENDESGRVAMAAAMEEMRRIDRLMSPYREDSELSRVNREAAGKPVPIGQDMVEVIDRALKFSEMTNGAFDITFASVGYLYDYAGKRLPSDKEIRQRLPAINYRHINLDRAHRTLHFARPGVRIDLGGIAKGYAVDNAIAILRARGVKHALVTAGGDSRVLGDRAGRPWRIGIRDPRNRDGTVTVLPLINAAISTSGDYEQYFERDGVRHHHILNPRTGKSAAGMHSVSIVGPDAMTTDGLSTSVFVMGMERGLSLVESLPGIEAVLIDDQGKMHITSGLRESMRSELPAGRATRRSGSD